MKRGDKNIAFADLLQRQWSAKSSLTKGERTKLALIESGITYIAQFGLESASISNLAQHAGVSRPLFSHYFPQKDALFQDAAEYISLHAQSYVATHVGDHHSFRRRLWSYVTVNLDWVMTFPHHFKFWILLLFTCTYSEKWSQFNAQLKTSARLRIEELLIQGRANGEWEISDPRWVANILHNQLYVVIINLNTEQIHITKTEVSRQKILLKQLLDILLITNST